MTSPFPQKTSSGFFKVLEDSVYCHLHWSKDRGCKDIRLKVRSWSCQTNSCPIFIQSLFSKASSRDAPLVVLMISSICGGLSKSSRYIRTDLSYCLRNGSSTATMSKGANCCFHQDVNGIRLYSAKCAAGSLQRKSAVFSLKYT